MPEACYVCGLTETEGYHGSKSPRHNYWSNADAAAFFAKEDAKSRYNGSVEHAYVASFIPEAL